MCWGRIQDQVPRSQLPKTQSLIIPADSPGLQEMEDQSPDLQPAPPAVGLRDAPPKGRRPEEDRVHQSSTDEE